MWVSFHCLVNAGKVCGARVPDKDDARLMCEPNAIPSYRCLMQRRSVNWGVCDRPQSPHMQKVTNLKNTAIDLLDLVNTLWRRSPQA